MKDTDCFIEIYVACFNTTSAIISQPKYVIETAITTKM